MLTVSFIATALAGFAYASPFSSTGAFDLFPRDISSGCSTTGPQSCKNTTAVSDLCCFEAPGGLLLQTQFWDFNPATGPADSWTIHGLWPDRCDLTYDSSCDPSRAYTGLADILTANNARDTLAYMQKYWVDINGQNEQFWEHEWSKHGTCMSTLQTKCLPAGSPKGAEAAAYFNTVVRLFKSLPTYEWLASAGITPSTTQTYTLATLLAALKKASGGFKPALDCTSNSINAISWYYNLKGSAIDGVFVPIDAPQAGTCSSTAALKYPPKGSPTTTSTSATSTGTSAPGSFPTKATIKAVQSGSTAYVGGLLSAGTWSTQTLATYTLNGNASRFTMTSSKGNCGVSGGVFSCGSGVTLTPFAAVGPAVLSGDLYLAYVGSTAFTSDGIPSGSTGYTVYTGSSHAQDYTLHIIGS